MANLRANRIVSTTGSNAITGSVEFTNLSGPGTLTGYLNIGTSTDYTISPSDNFTFESYIYATSVSDTTVFGFGNNSGFAYRIISGAPYLYINATGGILNTGSISANSWNHIAVTRNGGTLYSFINGILVGSVANTGDWNGAVQNYVGAANLTAAGAPIYGFNGFISNLRFIKGTALYTSDFIPPTRKLTKLPGTVLLCCQDSNDPTTEATGKTITGYGDLVQVGISTNLADSGSYVNGSTGSGVATFANNVGIITGTDSSNRGILYKTVSVIKGNKYEFSFRSTDASTNGKAGVDSNDGTNDVLDDVTNAPDLVYFSGSTVPNLDSTTGLFRQTFTATTNEAVLYFQEIGPGTLKVTDITVTAIDGRKGSDFTPSVGSDGSVEFAGPTTINTENYFYLPTGLTEQRFPNFEGVAAASARGLFAGGYITPAYSNIIDSITISTLGNAADFGDLTVARRASASCSSAIRGLFGGGYSPAISNTIDFVTIASTGNASDFGDLTAAERSAASCSNSTRGLFAGGIITGGASTNAIDYVTIFSMGLAIDFGDVISAAEGMGGCSSTTRGLIGGGSTPTGTNVIQYVTISTTANALDFGDLTVARWVVASYSNSTRGLWSGGRTPTAQNVIDYVTIASTGNAIDFGDLLNAKLEVSGCASSTRGVVAGGYVAPSNVNVIEYVTILSTGNSQDFGDLTAARAVSSCSNGHGGLG